MNRAMETVAGRLIEMNVQMVVTSMALALILVGVMVAVGLVISALMWFLQAKKWWWMLVILAAAFVAMAVVGFRMPRVKEIHACADGPISLERVSAVYDIVSINGKELILRAR